MLRWIFWEPATLSKIMAPSTVSRKPTCLSRPHTPPAASDLSTPLFSDEASPHTFLNTIMAKCIINYPDGYTFHTAIWRKLSSHATNTKMELIKAHNEASYYGQSSHHSHIDDPWLACRFPQWMGGYPEMVDLVAHSTNKSITWVLLLLLYSAVPNDQPTKALSFFQQPV